MIWASIYESAMRDLFIYELFKRATPRLFLGPYFLINIFLYEIIFFISNISTDMVSLRDYYQHFTYYDWFLLLAFIFFLFIYCLWWLLLFISYKAFSHTILLLLSTFLLHISLYAEADEAAFDGELQLKRCRGCFWWCRMRRCRRWCFLAAIS